MIINQNNIYMSEKYNQVEIGDEEEQKQTTQQQMKAEQDAIVDIHGNIIGEPYRRYTQQQFPEDIVQKVQKNAIKHEQIGQYANMSMEIEEQGKVEVKLKIIGISQKGTGLKKYTVYIIKGYDKKGDISVKRRFSEFHAMRKALCKRWPGCFIPSIPEKNYMNKNDKDQTAKRERYLNDFLYKITKIPHLYTSQEFQTLIRSSSEDISTQFDSWSTPTYQSVINKYRESFQNLAGKQIDQHCNDKIAGFYASIQKNQNQIEKYRSNAKNLAISRDSYNQHFPQLFSKLIPTYEQTLLNEYTNGKQQEFIFQNPDQAKMYQQSAIISDISTKNPYWLLYDMLKHQQRDGKAFMEMVKSRQVLESKKHSLQIKIKENQKDISQINEGKKSMKAMTSKAPNDELKFKLETETDELKKEQTYLTNLLDIITALIIYIEIPQYKEQKILFYQNVLKKIGGFEINNIQLYGDVWQTTKRVSTKMMSSQDHN